MRFAYAHYWFGHVPLAILAWATIASAESSSFGNDQPGLTVSYSQAAPASLEPAFPRSTPDFLAPERLPAVEVSNFASPAACPAGQGWLTAEPVGYDCDSVDLYPQCDECPKRGMLIFVAYDSWRGVQDGDWQNNGISSGFNFGTRLGRISDWTGIGFQIGASAAAFDWGGADYRLTHGNEAEPQGFVTYGLFRKANENSRWSAALVQDWMLNANFGVFGQNPTLGQWRGQAGYALNAFHEVGLWGTWRARGDERFVNGFGNVRWRAVNQLNAFYHYKWGVGAPDSWIWLGVPEHDRLAGGGSLGDYLVGLLTNAPLSDRLSVYSLVTYMHQSASASGPAGSEDNAWNFTIGLSFYPGRNARTNTVAGQCWMPMLPVANNGYFLVDTNQNF